MHSGGVENHVVGRFSIQRVRLFSVDNRISSECLDTFDVLCAAYTGDVTTEALIDPTCGACLGMSNGVLANGEVCAATTDRNFSGRMGRGGTVNLMSLASAAATAIAGWLYCRITALQGVIMSFGGNTLFLDRSDINTDEIIPARYLSKTDKAAMAAHLLEDLKLEGFEKSALKDVQAIVTKNNFGCGSSREHAVWALEKSGIRIVVAEGFARIFKRNKFNCGLLAISLPQPAIAKLFETFFQ